MSFSLRTDKKNRRVQLQIKDSPHLTRRGIRAAYFRIGNDLVEEARKSILEGPKTGNIRRIKKKRHQASAAGEAPANLTGLLKRSIAYQQRGGDQMIFGARTDYAPFLELGTRRMAQRPYLIAAIRKKTRSARKHLEKEIENELKRGGGR
jgi:HK97 gp10 family phage protein